MPAWSFPILAVVPARCGLTYRANPLRKRLGTVSRILHLAGACEVGFSVKLGRTLADVKDVAFRINGVAHDEPWSPPLLRKDFAAKLASSLFGRG